MDADADAYRRRIARHGEARRTARAEARRHLEAIIEIAPEALEAGVTKLEIATLGQISRTTLDAELPRPR